MKIIKILLKVIGVFLLILAGLAALAAAVIATAFHQLDVTNGTILSSGVERTYLLYVPDSYDPESPTPLVISIHGFAEWPAHQAQISRWDNLAEEYGFIVVYPSGTEFPRRWRADLGTDPENPYPDAIFIADLIDELEGLYNIDPARIYANGLSNGGGMSYLLGCALSGRIAAVGSVAGAYMLPLETCQPERPVAMIAFHGTADPIVPYAGGPAGIGHANLPDIREWIAGRAALNGCAQTPLEYDLNRETGVLRYIQCSQGADVTLYILQDGGHTWPGGEALPEWLAGTTSQAVDATSLMWEFFLRHPMAP